MKKILALVLAVVMSLALVACGTKHKKDLIDLNEIEDVTVEGSTVKLTINGEDYIIEK